MSIFSSGYFSASDLAQFQSTYNIPLHPVDHDPGSRNSESTCLSQPSKCYENNLDLQYSMAIAQNVSTTVT